MANTNNDKSFLKNNKPALNGSQLPKDTIQVFFPCVHGEARGQLVTISCFQANELKGAIKAVSGIDDETARRIIGAARYAETDDRAALGVIALFSNPLFGGESYGLCLALADKMIRYGSRGNWKEIYATGKIPPDGCGNVEAINEIEKKLDLILANGKPGSLFVLPGENVDDQPNQLKEKLSKLEKSGIKWVAIHDLKELDGILWKSTNTNNGHKHSAGTAGWIKKKVNLIIADKRAFRNIAIIGAACLIAIAITFLMIHNYKSGHKITNTNVIDNKQKESTKDSIEKVDQTVISSDFENNDLTIIKKAPHNSEKPIDSDGTQKTDKENKTNEKKNVLESAPVDGMPY